MSFLTRTTMFNASRTSARFAPRAFSTSFVARKSATETVADAAKTVDRKVSDVLVDGIEASRTYLPLSHPITLLNYLHLLGLLERANDFVMLNVLADFEIQKTQPKKSKK